MDATTILEGITITLIGVLIVFGVLTILVAILYGLKYIYIRETSKKEAIIKEKEEVKEKQARPKEIKIMEEKTKAQIHDPQLISIITAAIILFNEYKAKKLSKYDIFRDMPELSRILGLAGISFRAELVVSLGGKDQQVTVEEIPGDGYRVHIGNKNYIAQISV